jgi:cellulose synthase/poly-beta-1,6-N-acetylglucosamine synthase-like glycosyltransferase
MEARARIELANSGFADRCITPLLSGHIKNYMKWNIKKANFFSSDKKVSFIVRGKLIIVLTCLAYIILNHRTTFNRVIVNTFYLHLIIKSYFLFVGMFFVKTKKTDKANITEYPIYTILIPMFKENEAIVNQIIKAIDNINYPKSKLDVKILLEESDKQTQILFQNKILPDYLKIILVPYSIPQTKPKALNYGMVQTKGKYCVVYDAEDIPDPDQLLDALNTFVKENADIIQYPLKIKTNDENTLESCFRLEYAIWFKYMLTGISRSKCINTLGGTSNHFKIEILKHKGWDVYNVTEDLALGVDLSLKKKKFLFKKTHPTLEEAPKTLKSWMMQRRRWYKGYLYTYLDKLFKVGLYRPAEFFSFHFFIGGLFISILVTPFVFIDILINFKNSQIFLITSIIFTLIYNYAILKNLKKCKLSFKIKSLIGMNLYILLHFVATVLALYDLVKSPFYWHKTEHFGIDA